MYWSPEQMHGRALDKRADVWAFGCVLYEALTGRRAFGGDDLPGTIAAVLREEPDWSLLPVEVPASVRTLLSRCLEKDAARRLRDIGDVRIMLEDAAAHVGASLKPAPAKTLAPSSARMRRAPFLAAATAAVVVLVAAVALYVRSELAAPVDRTSSIAVLPLDNLSPSPDDAYFAAGLHDEILNQLAKLGTSARPRSWLAPRRSI